MLSKRLLYMVSILGIISTLSTAQSNATIKGFIIDQKTGVPFYNVVVDIYKTDNHSSPVASVKTDTRGYYETEVPPGHYYDIYVRFGDPNPNQRTPSAVEKNGIYTVNFNVYAETTYTEKIVEKYGFWIVAVVAVIILTSILLDQLIFRKRRFMGALEQEQVKLKKKLDEVVEEPGDELMRLQKEKHTIEYMINLTTIKYHKRTIDEESFREIIRDYQKRLIEIEARIEELKPK